jgi:hypothetical protein
MANPNAVPGTVVSSGALITPAGGTGAQGVQGPGAPSGVSTDSGNTATLGTDSKVYVPATPLASASVNGLLKQVSGSTRDLIDGTNNSRDIEVASTWRKRYYFCWHCDHPLSGNELTGVYNGDPQNPALGQITDIVTPRVAGASVGPVVSEAKHYGVYQLFTGDVSYYNAYAYYASNTVKDFSLTVFTKLAFRCVFKLPNGYGSGSNASQYVWGFCDTPATKSPSNAIYLIISPDASYYRYYLCTIKSGALTNTNINMQGTFNSWEEVAIYWDANGAQLRFTHLGTIPSPDPPSSLTGPVTTNVPIAATSMQWLVQAITYGGPFIGQGTSGTINVDLIEVCGEYATPGDFRGEELVTNP